MNKPRNAAPALDLLVFGATGFTGRLIAEHLLHRAPAGLRWGLAGRDPGRLAEVRVSIGAPADLPLLQADAADAQALARLAAGTRAVISTVGPYQRHGEPLLRACAQAGTDYLDLCGEPTWMARMIPQLQAPAAASGARLLFSCGFDSIPFELGVIFLQTAALERFGSPLREVHGLVDKFKGGASGGTLASLFATLEAMRRDPAQARLMADPFALTAEHPGWRGPAQPDPEAGPAYDGLAGSWTAPFVMAAINTKNVQRSHALRGRPWGDDFVYSERMACGDGPEGERRARRLARWHALQNLLLGWAPSRALLARFALPRPGQGPGKAEREAGFYLLRFVGQTREGQVLSATVHGDRDPGYGSTAKLISEAALCLLQDVDRQTTPGGVWTPGAALGLMLQRRLAEHAGLSFTL